MVVRFQLFGYFKAMTGQDSLSIELDETSGRRVLDALKAVNDTFAGHGFSIMKDGGLKKGILVLSKTPAGKTFRVGDDYPLGEENPVLLLSNLMGGG